MSVFKKASNIILIDSTTDTTTSAHSNEVRLAARACQ